MNLEIRKNTLPYVHPFSIVDIETNEVFGEYRSKTEAKRALKSGNFKPTTKPTDKNAIECMEKRIKNPHGDGDPIKTRQKNIRRIRLK